MLTDTYRESCPSRGAAYLPVRCALAGKPHLRRAAPAHRARLDGAWSMAAATAPQMDEQLAALFRLAILPFHESQ